MAFGSESELNWVVGEGKSEADVPKNFYPAAVPGAVQLDFAKALKYPDYRFADNVKQFQWMEDRFFTYKTTFAKKDIPNGKRLVFKSDGIDYKFKIYFNGKEVHSQESMFTPVEIDLTDLQEDNNTLSVVIFPSPKADRDDYFGKTAMDHRTLARKSVKPPVSYGWDWHPRLITAGIYTQTKIVEVNKSRISDFYVNYSLSEDNLSADITLETDGVALAGLPYKWELKDSNGNVVLSKSGIFKGDSTKECGIKFKNPILWWPNGYGNAYILLPFKKRVQL